MKLDGGENISENIIIEIYKENLPEKPHYKYVSGLIEESGKRYFTEGKIDKKGSSIERNVRRIMLIELPEWKNLKEIYEFLNKNEHYFEELEKKENPFEKIESGEEKKNDE